MVVSCLLFTWTGQKHRIPPPPVLTGGFKHLFAEMVGTPSLHGTFSQCKEVVLWTRSLPLMKGSLHWWEVPSISGSLHQ